MFANTSGQLPGAELEAGSLGLEGRLKEFRTVETFRPPGAASSPAGVDPEGTLVATPMALIERVSAGLKSVAVGTQTMPKVRADASCQSSSA